MHPLRCIHRESALAPPRVQARFVLWGNHLQTHFEVSGSQRRHVLHHLRGEGPHWGLWDGDVVELFIRVAGSDASQEYFEFQVSPLGQSFELKILKPRAEIDRNFRSGFLAMAEQTAQDSWSATMQVDLRRLGWGGDPGDLEGGAFAILGKPGARSYHSLFLPEQAVPDFHIPSYFKPLPLGS